MTLQELEALNKAFLENPNETTFKQFEEGAKLYYGKKEYEKCKEFFLTFGGADMCDFMS